MRRHTPETLAKSFWANTTKKPGGCVVWNGPKNRTGYGNAKVWNKTKLAHRVAWFITHGEWPNGCVCHRCDVPTCVNPSHLFLGSHQDNMTDMVRKGRQPVGERNGSARLTENDVRRIRKRLSEGEQSVVLASEFCVSKTAIWHIKRGSTWTHVR